MRAAATKGLSDSPAYNRQIQGTAIDTGSPIAKRNLNESNRTTHETISHDSIDYIPPVIDADLRNRHRTLYVLYESLR